MNHYCGFITSHVNRIVWWFYSNDCYKYLVFPVWFWVAVILLVSSAIALAPRSQYPDTHRRPSLCPSWTPAEIYEKYYVTDMCNTDRRRDFRSEFTQDLCGEFRKYVRLPRFQLSEHVLNCAYNSQSTSRNLFLTKSTDYTGYRLKTSRKMQNGTQCKYGGTHMWFNDLVNDAVNTTLQHLRSEMKQRVSIKLMISTLLINVILLSPTKTEPLKMFLF